MKSGLIVGLERVLGNWEGFGEKVFEIFRKKHGRSGVELHWETNSQSFSTAVPPRGAAALSQNWCNGATACWAV